MMLDARVVGKCWWCRYVCLFVYSLSVIAYTLCTLQFPFSGKSIHKELLNPNKKKESCLCAWQDKRKIQLGYYLLCGKSLENALSSKASSLSKYTCGSETINGSKERWKDAKYQNDLYSCMRKGKWEPVVSRHLLFYRGSQLCKPAYFKVSLLPSLFRILSLLPVF